MSTDPVVSTVVSRLILRCSFPLLQDLIDPEGLLLLLHVQCSQVASQIGPVDLADASNDVLHMVVLQRVFLRRLHSQQRLVARRTRLLLHDPRLQTVDVEHVTTRHHARCRDVVLVATDDAVGVVLQILLRGNPILAVQLRFELGVAVEIDYALSNGLGRREMQKIPK